MTVGQVVAELLKQDQAAVFLLAYDERGRTSEFGQLTKDFVMVTQDEEMHFNEELQIVYCMEDDMAEGVEMAESLPEGGKYVPAVIMFSHT